MSCLILLANYFEMLPVSPLSALPVGKYEKGNILSKVLVVVLLRSVTIT